MKGNPKRKRNMRRDREDTRSKRMKEQCEEKDEYSARNDVSWYTRYPELSIAAASFPYPYRPGMDVEMGSYEGTSGAVRRYFNVPGVMALNWAPSLGVTNSATSPASVAAKEIYAKVRSKYSGALEADAPDFMVYLMALDSIFSYIAWLKRIYRTLNAWSPSNYVVPDVVLASFGLRTDDVQALRNNMTNLWQGINELVLQSRKFTCPALMDVFNRHYWMSDNVYTDANSINSQFYVYNLAAVYKYAALPLHNDPNNTGAGLQLVRLPNYVGATIDVPTLVNFGRSLIEALVAWDDAYTINGYLMRAFEGAPSFVVAELLQNEVLTPVYEEEVLVQIENSMTLPCGSLLVKGSLVGSYNVTQDVLTNSLISNPSYTVPTDDEEQLGSPLTSMAYTMPSTLSIRSDTPTVADNIIASRLMARVLTAVKGTNSWTVTFECGTEIPFCWLLYTTKHATTTSNPDVVNQLQMREATGAIQPYLMSVMSQFDWHPFVWLVPSITGPATNGAEVIPLGDVHNITTITEEMLQNLHRICLFSEFNSFSIA